MFGSGRILLTTRAGSVRADMPAKVFSTSELYRELVQYNVQYKTVRLVLSNSETLQLTFNTLNTTLIQANDTRASIQHLYRPKIPARLYGPYPRYTSSVPRTCQITISNMYLSMLCRYERTVGTGRAVLDPGGARRPICHGTHTTESSPATAACCSAAAGAFKIHYPQSTT